MPGLRDELNAIVGKIRAAPASDKNAAAEGFNAAKTLIDGCVVAAKALGLSDADVRGYLKKSDDFLRAHSSERNKFELAREAFWSFTPDSTMAICVAMAQDAFVFIMKFLSEIHVNVNIHVENSGNKESNVGGQDSIDSIFKKLDRDGDGKISVDEFRAMPRTADPPQRGGTVAGSRRERAR